MDIGQYDLNAGSLAAINASLISVYNQTKTVTGRGLQIGPDGKIYLVSVLNSGSLSVINNPNVYGVGCNYQDQIVSLGGKQGSLTLPSFIASFDYSNELIQCGKVGISENTFNKYLSIYPNPFSSFTTLEVDNIFHNAVLTVYNFHGQIVKQMYNLSGQTIIFQRDNLPSGLYFLRLTGDNTIFYDGKIVITN